MELLLAFLDGSPFLSVPELAARTALPTSTVYRLLSAMRQRGLMDLDPVAHKYRLGPTLFRLGVLAGGQTDLRRAARPVMVRLAAASGESSFLSIRSGNESVYIESAESPNVVRFTAPLGRATPLHAGASAKCILAFLPEDERAELIRRLTLTALAPNTITSRPKLLARLALIRERGYDFSEEEVSQGAWGLATPVFGEGRRILGALTIAGLRFRLNLKRLPELTQLVRTSAEELSGQFHPVAVGAVTPGRRGPGRGRALMRVR